MLRLGLVGVSIHDAPLELLSALTIPRAERDGVLKDLARSCGFSELVYLNTCNRVEFVFQTIEEQPLHSSRNRILDFFFRDSAGVQFQPENFHVAGGIETARHLFTVASALDSLVIGEAQILGQVKEAYTEAERIGLVGDELKRQFQAAFHCAKKVRRETEIGTKRVSMVSLAEECIREFVSRIGTPRVALVGVGAMAGKLAEAFRAQGVRDGLADGGADDGREGVGDGLCLLPQESAGSRRHGWHQRRGELLVSRRPQTECVGEASAHVVRAPRRVVEAILEIRDPGTLGVEEQVAQLLEPAAPGGQVIGTLR